MARFWYFLQFTQKKPDKNFILSDLNSLIKNIFVSLSGYEYRALRGIYHIPSDAFSNIPIEKSNVKL